MRLGLQTMSTFYLKSSKLNSREILGKDIHEVNWKEGIGDIAVRFDNFSAIPWILPHWYGEKNKRVTEIKEWAASRTFRGRALSLMKKGKQSIKASVRTTGEELLKLLELQNTKLTKSLNHDPLNSTLRTELVSKTLERLSKKASISLKQYRTLFLQAIMANSCGEVSTESLMLLKKIQDLYYLQAHKVCEDRVVNHQLNSKDSPEQRQEKEKIIAISTANLNIIASEKKYLNTKLRRLLAISQTKPFKLSVKAFQEWNPDEKNADEIKKKTHRSCVGRHPIHAMLSFTP